jgi:MraZ protein
VARQFNGEWIHKVDAKGRMSVPAPFRRALEEMDPDWSAGLNPNFVIMQGLSDHPRLECLTMSAAGALARIIQTYPPFSEEREEMEELIHAGSHPVQLDENGRVVLNQRLRESIGLGDEAMLVGMGERFHIWNAADYAAYRAARGARNRPAILARFDPSRLPPDAT